MAHTRKISLYAQASLFLFVSISVSSLFSQDIATTFAESDITMLTKETGIKGREVTLSQKAEDKLIKAMEQLLEAQKNKKEVKKLPPLTPAVMVSLGVRLPLLMYWCYLFANAKEKMSKGAGDAIGEVMKISLVGWLLSEPIKDHTKPYYEAFRDWSDEKINAFAQYLYDLINSKEDNTTETAIAVA